ncbi:MAG: pilus assembly protein PilP [Nitrospirae bacterium]|nr:pilus assembly protein PilP [Nitrospirota bacterium]
MLNRKNQKQNPKRHPKSNSVFLLFAVGILIVSLVGCKGENKKAVQQPPQSPPAKTGQAPAASEQQKPGVTPVQEQKPQTQTATQPGKPQKEDVKKEAEKDKPEEKAAEKKEYVYDPTGKRDPFRSAILGESLRGKETLPPLQRREISELKLIGIAWDKYGYNAMLETPDSKGYTIKVGTIVGPKKGVVKKITKRTVVIEEKYMDIIGEMKTREIIMELPSKEEVLE